MRWNVTNNTLRRTPPNNPMHCALLRSLRIQHSNGEEESFDLLIANIKQKIQSLKKTIERLKG